MNKIVEELKKVKIFYIATVEGNQPRVRPFSSVAEFEGHAYLCSGNFKDFYKQIKKNSHIEICAMYPDNVSWLRLSATLKEDDREEAGEETVGVPVLGRKYGCHKCRSRYWNKGKQSHKLPLRCSRNSSQL